MRRPLMLALLLALGATLLPAAPAGAVVSDTTIRLGRSIGDGVLLQSKARLDRKLGKGRLVKRARTSFGTLVTYRYAAKDLDVTYRRSKAVLILTKEGRYGTTKGLGVGASKRDLQRGYRSLRCRTKRVCTLGKLRPNARVTDFRLNKRGKVVSVMVGIVLD
jgi:hypothetical protein